MRTSPPASRRGPARRALATALVTIALTPSCKALNPAWYETGAGTESGSGSDSGGTTEDPTPTSTQGSDGTTAGASGSDSDGSSDATSPTTTEDPSTSDPVTVTETTDAPADMGGGAPMCDALEGELAGIDLKLLRDGESLTDACGSTTTVYGLYSFLQGEMELIDTDHCKTINEPSLYRLKGALPAGYEPNFEGFECVELWVRFGPEGGGDTCPVQSVVIRRMVLDADQLIWLPVLTPFWAAHRFTFAVGDAPNLAQLAPTSLEPKDVQCECAPADVCCDNLPEKPGPYILHHEGWQFGSAPEGAEMCGEETFDEGFEGTKSYDLYNVRSRVLPQCDDPLQFDWVARARKSAC